MQPLLSSFRPPAAVPAALREYRTVGLDARVAAATPHGLVLLLMERLAHQLRAARLATEAGESARRWAATDRALAIVDGLDSSLDDAQGGAVAQALHRAYALIRDQLAEGSAPALTAAEASARTLADAWSAIGGRR
jgi:flagellar protein FliS